MSHALHRLPALTDLSVDSINVLVRAVNDNFDALGRSLDAFEAPGAVANLQSSVKGVPERLIPIVPTVYDPAYFAAVIATLVAKINELLDLLRAHELID